jgi:hypothetical protein
LNARLQASILDDASCLKLVEINPKSNLCQWTWRSPTSPDDIIRLQKNSMKYATLADFFSKCLECSRTRSLMTRFRTHIDAHVSMPRTDHITPDFINGCHVENMHRAPRSSEADGGFHGLHRIIWPKPYLGPWKTVIGGVMLDAVRLKLPKVLTRGHFEASILLPELESLLARTMHDREILQ